MKIKLELEFEDIQTINYALMMYETDSYIRMNMCKTTGNFDLLHVIEKQLEYTKKAIKEVQNGFGTT